LSYTYRVENEKRKRNNKTANFQVKEIEDLKQSEGFERLKKIAHYASHLETQRRCASGFGGFQN
jgi:hypothetical protein